MLRGLGLLSLLGALGTGAYLYFHDGEIKQNFHLKNTPNGVQLEHQLQVKPAASSKSPSLPKPVHKKTTFKRPVKFQNVYRQDLHEPCGALAWNGGVGCPSYNVYPPRKYEIRPG